MRVLLKKIRTTLSAAALLGDIQEDTMTEGGPPGGVELEGFRIWLTVKLKAEMKFEVSALG